MAEESDGTELLISSVGEWMDVQFGWNDKSEPLWKDDWSLIVRLHATIETGLNGALVREFANPDLTEVVAKLDTSSAAGKVAFAKALGIIFPQSAVFIQHLSQLRNKCVHDVRNFKFNLIDFLATDKHAHEYTKAFNKMAKPERHNACPQEKLLIGTMCVMTELMLHDQRCHTRDLQNQIARHAVEFYDAHLQSKPKES